MPQVVLYSLLVMAALFAMSAGHEWVSPDVILKALSQDSSLQSQLLLNWRFPHVIAAGFVGALLGIGGALFQGTFRNPLAEPYLLGCSGGAAVGATIALLVPTPVPSNLLLALLSFLGAWGATWLVLIVAGWHNEHGSTNLLLAGVAIGAMLGALRSFLMLALSDDSMNLQVVLSWTLGGIQTPGWAGLCLLAVLSVGSLAGALFFARGLDLLGLGNEQAHAFGLDPDGFIRKVVIVASAIVAIAVAWGGMVAFVGLIAPHIARWRRGPCHRRVIPESAAIGATLVLVCDALARSIMPPAEIPLGLVTAFFGGPFFLFVLSKKRNFPT